MLMFVFTFVPVKYFLLNGMYSLLYPQNSLIYFQVFFSVCWCLS